MGYSREARRGSIPIAVMRRRRRTLECEGGRGRSNDYSQGRTVRCSDANRANDLRFSRGLRAADWDGASSDAAGKLHSARRTLHRSAGTGPSSGGSVRCSASAAPTTATARSTETSAGYGGSLLHWKLALVSRRDKGCRDADPQLAAPGTGWWPVLTACDFSGCDGPFGVEA